MLTLEWIALESMERRIDFGSSCMVSKAEVFLLGDEHAHHGGMVGHEASAKVWPKFIAA